MEPYLRSFNGMHRDSFTSVLHSRVNKMFRAELSLFFFFGFIHCRLNSSVITPQCVSLHVISIENTLFLNFQVRHPHCAVRW
jgi:hypothetical protein